MEKKKMTKARIEKLAKEIRKFLIDREMWVDTTIYFNGKAFSTSDKDRCYYNDPKHLVVLEDRDPRDYFEYVGPYLSMSFEGPLYDVLNYPGMEHTEEEFSELLRNYGLYYELGNAWNLSVFDC